MRSTDGLLVRVLVSAALITSLLLAYPRAEDAALSPALASLVEMERAFARSAAQIGIRDSFLAYFADAAEALDKRLQDFPFAVDRQASLAAFLDQLKGARLELRLGFHEEKSHRVVDVARCLQLSPAMMDTARAAAAFGTVGLLSAIGRVTFGTLSDRWGRVPTALLSYAATAGGTLALLLLAPGSPSWLLWAYVLPFGLTLGARGPIVAALTADVYRGRNFGPVLGVITFGNRVGSAIGPWLGGVIYDVTGSYRLAFGVSIVALAVAAVAFAAAGRTRASD